MSAKLPAKPSGADFLKVAASSNFVLVLTAIHHLYGARLYGTPWRSHVVYFSIPAAILIAVLLFLAWRYEARTFGRVAARFGMLLALIFPIGLIGVFEGGYNHLLKNCLYFGGATDLVRQLFPPPHYELPHNVFFEVTGVAQLFAALVAGRYVRRLWPAISMSRSAVHSSRVWPGMVFVGRELKTIDGRKVSVPDTKRLVHIQFRRFAGCPVCNLHLQSFVQRHNEIAAAGILEVVVFHSSVEELFGHSGDLPFAVIADPNKALYVDFGVESSLRSLLDPRVWIPILRGVFKALPAVLLKQRRAPSLKPRGGRFGLPADFLIAADGLVVACKYGVHANDQWNVDEVLQLARSTRECEPLIPTATDDISPSWSNEQAGRGGAIAG
jgi:peroxiredoxin